MPSSYPSRPSLSETHRTSTNDTVVDLQGSSHPVQDHRSSFNSTPVAPVSEIHNNIIWMRNRQIKAVPVAPWDVADWRYERKIFEYGVQQKKIPRIPAMMMNVSHDAPEEWEACENPDGKLYFRNLRKRILTHTDIRDLTKLLKINQAFDSIQQKYNALPEGSVPGNLEYVLHLKEQEKREKTRRRIWTRGSTVREGAEQDICYYYLVSYENHAVMWAEEVGPEYLTVKYRVVSELGDLKHAMECQFWTHVAMFPKDRTIPKCIVNDLMAMLSFRWNDLMTSEKSTVSYREEHIQELFRILSKIPSKDDAKARDDHWTFLIAYNLVVISMGKFINFHGHPTVRFESSDKVKEKNMTRSWWFWLISPFLFWMPDVYLRCLEDIWIDDDNYDRLNIHLWNEFIRSLNTDWDNSTTPATVLLSANVGFLAIQSIDMTGPDRSVAQIGSYISTSFSLATYVIFQILARQHRPIARRKGFFFDTGEETKNYLKRHQSALGLEYLAVAFSVPIGCFIWSMLTFLLAVSFMFFSHTSTATRSVTGVIYAFMVVLSGVVVYMDWGSHP
ncbi:hypothetical protein QCA50_018926 [Cerrena zonata]|uniref:WW domain-containing protein n=1 Tax=Cerrena zonata TaxID=2478898 RepID=A0AAW0FBR8_9APHY